MATAAAQPQEAEAACLQSFELYESESTFYIFGTNSDKRLWRLLKIDRSETPELDIDECSTVYTETEYQELLNGLDEDHRSTGGVKFVTKFYGIIGFVKFLGPFYMLIITEQRKIGEIFDHPVYQVTKTSMVELANSKSRSSFLSSKDENRYKKILNTLDLRKDFFFCYSYPIMRSLQKNLTDPQEGWLLYESTFVWNEFLTRRIRNCLRSTLWTVALVYGFFKQDKFAISGKDVMFTLIARRSRHYAGTRYLKRGVNEKGRVANDVETEQIVYEAVSRPTEVSSVVQNRGSIPLFWSQDTSKLHIKPDITLHAEKDKNYEATKLHFENLRKRYGNPIIILNLIKTRERRESILRREFDKAIRIINEFDSEENHLRFLHWDLHKNSQGKPTNVLDVLLKVAFRALSLTEFFYCQVAPPSESETAHWPALLNSHDPYCCDESNSDISQEDISGSSDSSGNGTAEDKPETSELPQLKPPIFQKGVLRTNCIDCLDRTNVAQYAYGLAALGHQLHALGCVESPELGLGAPLAHHLMYFYERMGDTLAVQYSGSAAHNKIFSAKRGHLKLFIRSQEFFRTLQRHYSNACIDANKQAAINLFLGYFQPEQGNPALWELESSSEEHNNEPLDHTGDNPIPKVKSEGSLLCVSNASISGGSNELLNGAQPDVINELQPSNVESDLVDENEISQPFESEVSNSRYTPTVSDNHIHHVPDSQYYYCNGSGDSNFLDPEWLSNSGNSSDERSIAISSPDAQRSTENVISAIIPETMENQVAEVQGQKLPEHFVQWVNDGDTFWF
ncbi:hypothetical protein ACQ4PT_037244 [Festuca glaucescens]